MWLLHVRTKKLGYFEGRSCPKYAILSHRWEEDEVLYQDVIDGTAHLKSGYIKIEHTCRQAEADGFDYVWIDTCCIDKRSSAELSEAINSMYRWYQRAEICYAFLSDIRIETSIDIASSVWFTRGWTLQELLAPRRLVFYDSSWTLIGSKECMEDEIHTATKIPYLVLKDFQPDQWSIATRMSWAARRNTTRVEDQAYCLLGLFQVNMPLLYGEGPNAFIRLQEELCKMYTDRSIFAWNRGEEALRLFQEEYDTGKLERSAAFFAPSVSCFDIDDLYGDIIPAWPDLHEFEWRGVRTITVTNEGISIEARLRPFFYSVYMAELCYPWDWRKTNYILLRRADRNEPPRYYRVVLDGKWAFVGESPNYEKEIGRLCRKSITVLREPPIRYRSDDLEKMEECCLDVIIDSAHPGLRDNPTSNDALVGLRGGQEPSSDGETNNWRDESSILSSSDSHTNIDVTKDVKRQDRLLAANDNELESQSQFTIRTIRVPWQQTAWIFGCVYFPHLITNELLILFMGYDYDFAPLSVLQIWPSSFDRKVRSLYGFRSHGCGTKKVHSSHTEHIDCCKIFDRMATGYQRVNAGLANKHYKFDKVLRTCIFGDGLASIVNRSTGAFYPGALWTSASMLSLGSIYQCESIPFRRCVFISDSRSYSPTTGKLLVCDQLDGLAEWIEFELAERNKLPTQEAQKDSIPFRYLSESTETSSERELPRDYSFM